MEADRQGQEEELQPDSQSESETKVDSDGKENTVVGVTDSIAESEEDKSLKTGKKSEPKGIESAVYTAIISGSEMKADTQMQKEEVNAGKGDGSEISLTSNTRSFEDSSFKEGLTTTESEVEITHSDCTTETNSYKESDAVDSPRSEKSLKRKTASSASRSDTSSPLFIERKRKKKKTSSDSGIESGKKETVQKKKRPTQKETDQKKKRPTHSISLRREEQAIKCKDSLKPLLKARGRMKKYSNIYTGDRQRIKSPDRITASSDGNIWRSSTVTVTDQTDPPPPSPKKFELAFAVAATEKRGRGPDVHTDTTG